jgi:N-methylhydantoinase A/oxoprolinase/acetone carboxylase beta subunit
MTMGENGFDGFGGWRIGIDVGGTNTDAVVLDHTDMLVSKVKHPTTPDVTTGILRALEQVLAQVPGSAKRVRHVMLGTTHATNAILERRNLNRVAALRLGGPATHSIPPLAGWPTELRLAVSCGEVILDGGVEMTGEPIVPLDEDGARRFLESVAEQVECVAVSGVFSPVRADQEFRIEELVREILGEVPVSLSHEIGSLGLLERENACVLNAALVGVAGRVTAGLTNAMAANGIAAEAYIAQNDGTLMSLDYVRRYPILTIGSGPTNSMRGASYLTGATDALVVDVGGTSTDIGILASGFPRESSTAVEIGGVRTNFRMPDLVSVAIGGGSVLTEKDGAVVLGPNSVGYRLPKEALVFGGRIPTLTDAIVAVGRASGIGNAALAGGRRELFSRAIAECDARVEDAVDRVKTSGRELPLIAVGGGSGLIPETLAGVAGVLRPEHYEVANAIGAAIASVSGEVDRMFAFGKAGRDEAIAEAVRLAREEAIRAGADPAHVEIVEIDEIPLAYLTEPVARVRVKAAGPLKNGSTP